MTLTYLFGYSDTEPWMAAILAQGWSDDVQLPRIVTPLAHSGAPTSDEPTED